MKTMFIYEVDEQANVSCPTCGWTGRVAEAAFDFDEYCSQYDCPRCPYPDILTLIYMPHPTTEVTRRAAEAGHPAAINDAEAYGVEYTPRPGVPMTSRALLRKVANVKIPGGE